ncbi:hypothetical protein [Methylobacterium brachiatum]
MIDLELPLRELDRQIEEVQEHLYGHTVRLAQLMVQKECLLNFNEMVRSGAIRDQLGSGAVRDDTLLRFQESSTKIPTARTGGRAAEIVLTYLRKVGTDGASAKDLNEAVKQNGLTDAAADKAKTRLKQNGQVHYDAEGKKYYIVHVNSSGAQATVSAAA